MHFFWLALGLLLICDTIFALRMSNINLGVVLPAVLGAPLCCYAILLWCAPQVLLLPAVKTVLVIFAAGYLCVLLGLLFCVVVTVRYALRCKGAPADVVVVLGAGLRRDKPSRLLRARLDAAREAAERRNALLLVTGGQGRQEHISEAEAMRGYLLAQGVSPGNILVEDQAKNTEQNLRFSKVILEKRFALPKVLVVTSDFHCFRSAQIAKKYFEDCHLLPVPSAWYMRFNFYLREMLSIANYYRLQLFQK